MSDYPMLISNKLHSFRNFHMQKNAILVEKHPFLNDNRPSFCILWTNFAQNKT